nr:glycosyltransferase [Chitinophagaceae bacterium]
MQLSVIIVNYNVKYFLEHCLHSVLAASRNIIYEIIVVDNNSKDGSNEMVEEKFPNIVLIKNDINIGFAKANNQAFHIAKGKYILYLNPDTIVAEDCFEKCVAYMEQHEDVGALGCRLIDGKGQFLPESKRGYPSAWAAFCKISGLSSLFKKSKRFNQYHMGFLAENEIAEVDILVGCFMFCRKKVLDITGSFSEEYFMYGEDIDLSHKIIEAGYKNIYFPETTIIHYKGESTKKGSMNYVKMFYNAMLVFARKNFTGSNKNLYVLLISFAIYFRQFIAFFQRIFSLISLPLLDIIILTASLYSMKTIWATFIKTETDYVPKVIILFFVSYIIIWFSSLFFNGAYDKPYKSSRVLRGMFMGSIIILIFYSLLNESWRFSRGITLLGAVLGTVGILFFRVVLQKLKVKSVETAEQQNKKVFLVGDVQE